MKRFKRYTVFPRRSPLGEEPNRLEIGSVRCWFHEGPNVVR